MMARIVRWLLVLTLVNAPLVMHAQDGVGQRQQEKNLAKKAREDKKAKVRKEKKDRKHQLAIQDKATRKRVKQHTRRADRSGSGRHRDGFFTRLFGRGR